MEYTLNLGRATRPRSGKSRGDSSSCPAGGAVFSYLTLMAQMMATRPQYACGMEPFIMKHGRQMPMATEPPPARFHKGPNGHCFENASRVVMRLDDLGQPNALIYCEGLALVPDLIPLHHAWLCDRRGNVYDPTRSWERATDYYGIPFNHEFHVEMMLRTEFYGVLGRWESDWPLERGEYTPEQFLYPLK